MIDHVPACSGRLTVDLGKAALVGLHMDWLDEERFWKLDDHLVVVGLVGKLSLTHEL